MKIILTIATFLLPLITQGQLEQDFQKLSYLTSDRDSILAAVSLNTPFGKALVSDSFSFRFGSMGRVPIELDLLVEDGKAICVRDGKRDRECESCDYFFLKDSLNNIRYVEENNHSDKTTTNIVCYFFDTNGSLFSCSLIQVVLHGENYIDELLVTNYYDRSSNAVFTYRKCTDSNGTCASSQKPINFPPKNTTLHQFLKERKLLDIDKWRFWKRTEK